MDTLSTLIPYMILGMAISICVVTIRSWITGIMKKERKINTHNLDDKVVPPNNLADYHNLRDQMYEAATRALMDRSPVMRRIVWNENLVHFRECFVENLNHAKKKVVRYPGESLDDYNENVIKSLEDGVHCFAKSLEMMFIKTVDTYCYENNKTLTINVSEIEYPFSKSYLLRSLLHSLDFNYTIFTSKKSIHVLSELGVHFDRETDNFGYLSYFVDGTPIIALEDNVVEEFEEEGVINLYAVDQYYSIVGNDDPKRKEFFKVNNPYAVFCLKIKF